MGTQAWYALRVRSNREFKVRDSLNGIADLFLPTFTETVRWTDRAKTVVRPLFPGYLFAQFDRRREASHVLSFNGVVQILGNEYSSISDDEIANIRRVVNSPAPVSPCPYTAGKRITVARGPLGGAAGIVVRAAGATRLIVSIGILNRAVAVEIDAADVEVNL